MVMGIMSSLKPLLWALLLLGLIIYIFAIIMLQLIQEEMDLLKSLPHYASLIRLMYTLFMCISGGISWIEVVDPIKHINPMLPLLFVAYIAFSVFCVLNIVTGVFVEQSTRMAKEDDEHMLIEEIESRKKWMKDIEALFRRADTDGSGELSFEEFNASMSDVRIETALKNCGVDLTKTSLRHVWELLDFDNSGNIEIESFAAGLQQLHGDAKSIDIARLRHDMMKGHKKLNRMAQLDEKLNRLTQLCAHTFDQVLCAREAVEKVMTPPHSHSNTPSKLTSPVAPRLTSPVAPPLAVVPLHVSWPPEHR